MPGSVNGTRNEMVSKHRHESCLSWRLLAEEGESVLIKYKMKPQTNTYRVSQKNAHTHTLWIIIKPEFIQINFIFKTELLKYVYIFKGHPVLTRVMKAGNKVN